MGTVDNELVKFIRENSNLLEGMIDGYIYSIFKDEKIIYDLIQQDFLITKEDIIQAQIPDETLSIEEVTEKIYTPFSSVFSFGKQYLKRALYFVDNYKKEDTIYAKLLYSIATYYFFIDVLDENNLNNKCLPFYRKALIIQKKLLEKNNIDIANTRYSLGIYYDTVYNIEKYQKRANILLSNALKIKEKLLGLDNKEVLDIRERLESNSSTYDKHFFINSKNSSLSFRVDRVEIKDFKQFSSIQLDFSKNINIIIGENATGKTSLLQALTLALLRENSPDELTSYKSYIKREKTRRLNSSKVKIFFDKYEKNVTIERDKRVIDNNYFIPFLLSYGSNFFAEDYFDAKYRVKEILDKTVYDSFANSIFYDFTEEFSNPLRILEVLEYSKHKCAKRVQNIFLDTINSFLEEYKISSNIDDEFFFIKDNDETPLSLEDLSEGYRSNVLLITDMLIKILGVGWTPQTIEGIVLIDEFDKHLHPKWQSRLVNQLTETFPKIQFIMTTHNPMSILDRNPDEITILKEIDGEIVAVKKRVGTKKIGVSTILLEYFGVESTVSKTMMDNIDEFTKLKLKDKLTKDEEKKIVQLEEFLDETVATNFIYNRAYFNFLKFLKENKDIDFKDYEKMSSEEMEELLNEFKDLFE